MRICLLVLLCLVAPFAHAQRQHEQVDTMMDPDMAMRISQDAIGNRLGNYRFERSDGEDLYLADLAGKPYAMRDCHFERAA